MKTILKLAALAIIALTVLTSCSKETESITETTESPTIDKGKSSERYGYNLGFDLTEVKKNWTQMRGSFEHVEIGGNNQVWAYNSSGSIYSWDGSEWSLRSGTIKTNGLHGQPISICEDGSVWIIADNGRPCKWNGNGWTQYSAGMHFAGVLYEFDHIAAGNNNLWAKNSNGTVFRFVNGVWQAMYGSNVNDVRVLKIEVSPDGNDVWMIRMDDDLPYKLVGNELVQMGTTYISDISVGNNGIVWGTDIYNYPVKKQGNNWLVMGDWVYSLSVSPDGKTVWATKNNAPGSYQVLRYKESAKEPAAPANNPNNKYTTMNRALMDSTLKCFGKTNWQAQMANFNTVAGKTAFRDLYVGAYDQAIAKGTLNRFANLFVGGIGGTEYNSFVTSTRAVTLQSMNISLELTPPPSAVLLSPAADALQKEIINWRGNGVEEDGYPYPGYYTLTDLRNFLTAENSKIATANITEVERSLLYGLTSLRWEVETYLTSPAWENKACEYLFSGIYKAQQWTYRGCLRAMWWSATYGANYANSGWYGVFNGIAGSCTGGDGYLVGTSLAVWGGVFGGFAGWATSGDH